MYTVGVDLIAYSLDTWFDTRTSDEEGNLDIELEGHRLALDESELAQVIAVVAGVEDVRVVQLAQPVQLAHHLNQGKMAL